MTHVDPAALAAIATKRHEDATNAAINFAKVDALSNESKGQILEALKGADFPTFELIASVWQGTYTEEKGCEEVTGRMAWSRMCKAFDIEKPKSQNPEATAKAATRDAAKKVLAATPVTALTAQREAATEKAKLSLVSNPTEAAKAIAEVGKINAEIARREKDADKPKLEALNKKRTAVIDRIRKEANMEMLARIEELLDKVQAVASPSDAKPETGKHKKAA